MNVNDYFTWFLAWMIFCLVFAAFITGMSWLILESILKIKDVWYKLNRK